MTDTVSPITGPLLTPMFVTGAQPAASPNTEPTPAPIFDTGPHPDPLRAVAREPEPVAEWPAAEPESESASEAVAELDAGPDAAEQLPDSADQANAAAHAAAQAEAQAAADALQVPKDAEPATPQAFSELDNVDTDAFLRSVTGHLPAAVIAAQPVVVPGAFQFVKRWKFALIVAGVWLLAAVAGLGFYFWWYTALTKTIPVFGILLYLVVCMVGSLLVSMVPSRPQVSALAVALMAAPLASMSAAAVLHGAYFFEWIARPVIG